MLVNHSVKLYNSVKRKRSNDTMAKRNSTTALSEWLAQPNSLTNGTKTAVELLATFDKELMPQIMIVLFILAMFILMLLFTLYPMNKVTERIPSSLLFCVAGMILGVIITYGVDSEMFFQRFTSDVFLWILLPPIILAATYKLYSREFAVQLDAVLLMAVVGTIFNVFGIAGILMGVDLLFGYDISFKDYLMLSTIIAAVDPVAVLTVFDQLHVQKPLMVLVLGESLLNDGVTLVVYTALDNLKYLTETNWVTYVLACISFITIGLGGFIIGFLFGMLAAFFCKYTTDTFCHFEPLWILGTAYFSFVICQTFHWSGIMAIIGCGISQKRYAFKNINPKSRTTLDEVVEGLSISMETIIFLLFGISIFSVDHTGLVWPFSLLLLLICLVFRFIVVFAFGYFMNSYRHTSELSTKHLIIMSYGGLRGAVTFAMSQGLTGPTKALFQTSSLLIILLTCFLQGGTVRFLVEAFKFQEEVRPEDIGLEMIEDGLHHTMAGVAVIVGIPTSLKVLEKVDYWDKHYIQRHLVSQNR